MEIRHKALSELQNFIKEVDQQVIMILQNLQWDRKCLLEDAPKVACSYNKSHKLSPNKKESHKSWCFLKSHGYEKDLLLPDPLDVNASTLVKLDKQAITTIINNASCGNPSFRQGNRSHSPEPWTLERLQATYTADERRAMHDAVVQAVPSCHDLADLALPSKEDGDRGQQTKSRNEILAELRDMKRRRAKYRVAAKTRKYSDVLRDVIKTQMELYTGAATQTAAQSDLVKSIQMKGETSIRESMDKQRNYEMRNRSMDNSTESERVRTSLGRGMEGRQPNDYCPTSYKKNKDKVPIGIGISSASEKEKYTRRDYSRTSRYEIMSHKIDKNVSTERINVPFREGIERQTQNYCSTSSYAKRDMELSQEATREKRKHNKDCQKYRYGENNDNSSRKRRENENWKDYPYTGRSKRTRHNNSRSRRRESSGSSETNYTSPRRKDRDSRERYYNSSRKRDRDRDAGVSIKMERDETPGRESTDREPRSSYSYSSTYRSKRHTEYDSASESDTTIRRRTPRKVKDYKTSHKRDRYTNVHIKMEKEDTPERDIEREMRSGHRHTSKSHRKRDNRRSRSSEESYRPSRRSREREGRHSYKSSYENNNSADTGLRIKTERDSTPEEESSHIVSRYYPVPASTHSKHMRRDSNSSWE